MQQGVVWSPLHLNKAIRNKEKDKERKRERKKERIANKKR